MKRTRLYSILFNKCPRCHNGDFFVHKNPFNFKTFTLQHEHCPVCNESYHPETGFYYGAMYASYALCVGLGLTLFLVTNVLFDLGPFNFLLIYVSSVIVLWPWIYRKARLLWINIFIGPKPDSDSYRKTT